MLLNVSHFEAFASVVSLPYITFSSLSHADIYKVSPKKRTLKVRKGASQPTRLACLDQIGDGPGQKLAHEGLYILRSDIQLGHSLVEPWQKCVLTAGQGAGFLDG